MKLAIVDYKLGNLQSVRNAFSVLEVDAKLQSDPNKLKNYDKLILPGVGAFGDAMESLRERGMDEAVREYTKSGRFVMGICLGMQLLFEKSYEFGTHDGLGLIKGEVMGFDKDKFSQKLKIPHMGWNALRISQKDPLFKDLEDDFYLYFVHSYHVKTDEKNVIGTTHYGYKFASAVRSENIFGFQPHPEKSHKNGLKILENFINLKE